MTTSERKNFRGYLRNCTDAQLYGVLEKETKAGREDEMDLTEQEIARRDLRYQGRE